jgi:hypothetical protein
MSPVMETIMFGVGCTVWGGLIILGMSPELGARVGLWLRGSRLPKNDPENHSWRDWPGDSRIEDASVEERDKYIGKNLDRFV